MTVYFDAIDGEILVLEQRADAVATSGYDADLQAAIEAVERRVVLDVSLCAEWVGCPHDVRDAIHRVVLQWSPLSQPHGSVASPSSDYDDAAAYVRGIGRMCSDLHTVYHTLGSRHLVGFTDDPRRPLWNLAGVGEERRESMTAPNLRYWRTQIDDYDAADQQAARERVAQRAYDFAWAHNDGDVAGAKWARDAAMTALTAKDGDQ